MSTKAECFNDIAILVTAIPFQPIDNCMKDPTIAARRSTELQFL